MSKMVLQDPSSKLSTDLLRMDRRNLKQVVELITGHGHWRKHMHRMGVFMEEPICRKCGQQEETAEHLLFDCEPLTQARLSTFGLLSRADGPPQ